MYDVIVIGTGGVGSAALYELARRGAKVLGIDRFPAGHDRGSSHGQSRVVRRAYFEHVNYVPLLSLAYTLWDDLCRRTEIDLFHRTGLLYVGQPESPVIRGVIDSSRQHRIEIQHLTADESTARFPGFLVPEGAAVLFEPDAGYVLVEESVRAHVREAKRLGAVTIDHAEVIRWTASDRGVVVETQQGSYTADKLVVTAGCWSRQLLTDLEVDLRVVRKHLHWFATDDDRYAESHGSPCFFYAIENRYFYGFPSHDSNGLKIAEHSGGTAILDPLSDDRSEEPDDTRSVKAFLQEFLPDVSSSRLRHEVCFYTMSSDEHFIIDRHPHQPHVLFAAGLSGHGYKFVPAIGRVLAELALDGESSSDMDFLGLDRKGLRRGH